MPHKLRLFNLNVLHGYPEFDKQEYRFRATVGEIKRLDADILVLQETWNTVEHGSMAQCLSAELGFDCCYARANGSLPLIGFEEGSAILSRFPIKSAKRIVLKPKSPWWENRIALMAKIETGGGELTVVGVHLSYTSPDEQAECLLQNTSEHAPDIIAGDFNALPESGAMSAFRKRGFLEVVPANKSDEPWIDHVFLSPTFASRWEIKESKWISATKAVPDVRDAISDHDGILIDLQRR
jgi:endonuclease/exonuclease/phosphatase family metal-dependent hydrolase